MTTRVTGLEPAVPLVGRDVVSDVLSPLDEEASGSVGVWEVVRVSFESLTANKTRSALTMLGVIIGVASVVALLALGNGAQASITGELNSIGTNLLTIIPSTPRTQGPSGMSTMPQTLTMDDAQAIIALGLPVTGVAPQFTGSADLVAAAAEKQATVMGTTPDFVTLNNLVLAAGAFFDAGQERSAAAVVVLGADLKTDLFGTGEAVGQMVRAKDQPLRVIGVLEKKGGNGFGSIDSQAFVPISLAQQRLFGARTPDGNGFRVSNISLAAEKASDVDGIQARIEALMRDRHRMKTNDGTADDFRVFSQASLLGTLTSITGLFTTFLAAIAGISLLVGGIGIMNIMLVSVTERTREIGLRKAVGARGRDILFQFIVEALVISVTGGLIGLTLGILVAYLVTLSGILTTVVSASSVAMSLSFSLAVGLFFGIYPARRAAQLNPIDALRHE